jgi:hypothetical protein
LAGIAYCRRLEFVCKAAGQTVETTIVYDCDKIKEGLADGSDLDAVFQQSVSLLTSDSAASADSHYTCVKMLETDVAPKEINDIGQLAEYLRNIAPLDFDDQWSFAEEIRSRAKEDGFSIPVVKVSIGTSQNDLDEIRKPYAKSMAAGRRKQVVESIAYQKGTVPGGAKWWGWHGVTPLFGAISEPEVAGIRMRVKNIQLDGKEIIARIMRDSAYSYERFQPWHLGEIYVDAGKDSIFPNARRDGFEDSAPWRVMEKQIQDYLTPLIAETYKASSARNSKDFGKVFKDTQLEISEITAVLNQPVQPDADVRKSLARKIRSNIKKIESLSRSYIRSYIFEAALKALRAHLTEPKVIAAFLQEHSSLAKRASKTKAKEVARLQKDIEGLEKERSNLIAAIKNGGDSGILNPEIAKIQEQVIKAKIAQDAFLGSTFEFKIDPPSVEHYVKLVDQTLERLTRGPTNPLDKPVIEELNCLAVC